MKKRVIHVLCVLILSSTRLFSSQLDETNQVKILRIPFKFVSVSHNDCMPDLRGRGTRMTLEIFDHIPLTEALKQGLKKEKKFLYQQIFDSRKYPVTSLSSQSLEQEGYVLEPVEFLYHKQKKDGSFDATCLVFDPLLPAEFQQTAKDLGLEGLIQKGFSFKLEFKLINRHWYN